MRHSTKALNKLSKAQLIALLQEDTIYLADMTQSITDHIRSALGKSAWYIQGRPYASISSLLSAFEWRTARFAELVHKIYCDKFRSLN